MSRPNHIYTDGTYNRTINSAGVGGFFGHGHALNFGKQLGGQGKSSGRAEAEAIAMSLQKLHVDPHYNGRSAVVRTDNLNVINGLRNPGTGVMAAKISAIRGVSQTFPKPIHFEHVHKSVGLDGNRQAHSYARQAMKGTTPIVQRAPTVSSQPKGPFGVASGKYTIQPMSIPKSAPSRQTQMPMPRSNAPSISSKPMGAPRSGAPSFAAAKGGYSGGGVRRSAGGKFSGKR